MIWQNIGLSWKITEIRTTRVFLSHPKQEWHIPQNGIFFYCEAQFTSTFVATRFTENGKQIFGSWTKTITCSGPCFFESFIFAVHFQSPAPFPSIISANQPIFISANRESYSLHWKAINAGAAPALCLIKHSRIWLSSEEGRTPNQRIYSILSCWQRIMSDRFADARTTLSVNTKHFLPFAINRMFCFYCTKYNREGYVRLG